MNRKRARHLKRYQALRKDDPRILRQVPADVNWVADIILFIAALVFVISFVPGLVIIAWLVNPSRLYAPLYEIVAVTLVILGGALFLALVARDFRRMKRWTYGIVTFLLSFNVFFLTGLKERIERDEIRMAFGLKPLEKWERETRL